MQYILKFVIWILNFLYSIIKRITKIQNKITIISRQSDFPSNDILLLSDAIRLQDSNIKVVALCKTLGTNPISIISYAFHMILQLYHLSTSKAIVLDSYCIVASLLTHKKSLIIFQMWHSMGTMKKFGYSAIGTQEGSDLKIAKIMKMHSNYDFVFASSPAYLDHLMAGFNIERQKIVIKPLPRLDLLTNMDYQAMMRQKLISVYPHLSKKKNILYCPTFRKASHDMYLPIKRLIDCVDFEKYNLIVKLHPLFQPDETLGDLFTADKYSTFDLLSVADYIISDYSCVVYEAAVLDIPLYFYAFDFEEYQKNRGLAIDYRAECPGVISSNPKEIMEAISTGEYDMDRLKQFCTKYIVPTKTAAKDMALFIINQLRRKDIE